jgi:hypothetical protein
MSHQLQNSTKCTSHTAAASHNALYSKVNCTIACPFCWPTLQECINYTPWRRLFKGWNVLELRTVSIKWCFNNIWVRLPVSGIINSTIRHRVYVWVSYDTQSEQGSCPKQHYHLFIVTVTKCFQTSTQFSYITYIYLTLKRIIHRRTLNVWRELRTATVAGLACVKGLKRHSETKRKPKSLHRYARLFI